MTPTPHQIKQAAANHRRPPITLGARVRSALSRVKHQKSETPLAGGVSGTSRQTTRRTRGSRHREQ
jgi:hypothetical protein